MQGLWDSDLRLVLSTGQGETAKPLRRKPSSVSVWPPPPRPTPLWSMPSVLSVTSSCLSGLLVVGRWWEGQRVQQGN